MEAKELLSYITDLGVTLWVDGDDLRYSAPREGMTQELCMELARRKADIVTLLHQTQAAVLPDQVRAPKVEQTETFGAPRTAMEKMLAEIWAEVLGVERVGIHDNFFELGGDSLSGLRAITKASRAGLRLVPHQLLECQTIAELAAVEGTVSLQAEQGLVTGPVPLTNANSDTFCHAKGWDLSHHNVVAFFQVPQDLNLVLLERAIKKMLVHHDGLRIRFAHDESGWQSFIDEPQDDVPFITVDISELSAEYAAAIEAVANELHRSFDLSEGPLVRVAFFYLGAHKMGRVLVIMNHRTGDAVSMQIFVEDLLLAYQQLDQGEQVHLPPKTVSLKQWGELVEAYVRSPASRRELDYWLTLPWAQVPFLPLDYPERKGCNTIESYRDVKVTLKPEETEILLREIPRFYETKVINVLLAASAKAISRWTGGRWVQFTVQDSGRSVIPDVEVDLSRTIGSLTCKRVLLLECEEADNPIDMLKSIGEQLRRIPNRGFGYRLLCYSSGDVEILNMLSQFVQDGKYVFFNYMSQSYDGDRQGSVSRVCQPAYESTGVRTDPRSRPALLRCTAMIAEGQFVASWKYSENAHKRVTIERVANDFIETLRTLIVHRSRIINL